MFNLNSSVSHGLVDSTDSLEQVHRSFNTNLMHS